MVQQVYPQLIVVNGLASPDTYKVISSSEAYLLSKTDVSMPTSELIEVAQFFVGNNSYSLMKKVSFLLEINNFLTIQVATLPTYLLYFIKFVMLLFLYASIIIG